MLFSIQIYTVKELKVVAVKEINYGSTITEISGLLDRLDKNKIEYVPWSAYPYQPSASFTIAYGPDCLFLKYFNTEKEIRAINWAPNSPVWQDSCVEFFVSFNEGKDYYNFEINCIGAILAAHGPGRENRDAIPGETINSIKSFIVIDRLTGLPDVNWDLVAVIPFTAFIHDNISSLRGMTARANFYKCGDNLEEPHYLAWNDIKSEQPDFHLPEYFGRLKF